MKHFDYFAPTEIIFGAGRVTEAGALAARYGKKAMLVTVPEFPAVAELYAKVKKSLADAGVACVHYDGVIPNPTTELVTRGAELAKAEGSEVLPICAQMEADIAELEEEETGLTVDRTVSSSQEESQRIKDVLALHGEYLDENIQSLERYTDTWIYGGQNANFLSILFILAFFISIVLIQRARKN